MIAVRRVKEGVVIYWAFNASREVQAAVAGRNALAQPAPAPPRQRGQTRGVSSDGTASPRRQQNRKLENIGLGRASQPERTTHCTAQAAPMSELGKSRRFGRVSG